MPNELFGLYVKLEELLLNLGKCSASKVRDYYAPLILFFFPHSNIRSMFFDMNIQIKNFVGHK